MKPAIRNLEVVGDPTQVWTPGDLHAMRKFLKDQWDPVHSFLEGEGIPYVLEHPIYEDRQRELLERVQEWGEVRYQEGLSDYKERQDGQA